MKPGKHGGDRYQNGHVSEDEKTQIAKLWNEGKSAAEIAKRVRGGRSRNAVIGIVTRMRDKGDPRIVRDACANTVWNDAESLKLLALRENDQHSFRRIGEIMAKPGASCRKHYEDILRDMKAAGW